MTHTSRWAELKRLVREELQLLLLTFKPSDRLWQMPFAAALATGLPLLIGAYFDHMDYGLVSSLGGLMFLYLPNTPLSHRMVTLMACAFAMTACYTLGQTSPAPLIQARFFDTVLGCLVGLGGGICLHSPRFRAVVGGQMRWLVPSRLVR